MELRHLRYFVVVAEELSFTRAATRLTMAQPPLSQQIGKLERELGTPLFDRGNRGLKLTGPGQLLLNEARELLGRADETRRLVGKAGQGAIGVVRLGCVSSAFSGLLREVVPRLRAAHPGLVPLIQDLEVAPQLDALARGAIDIGFLRARSVPPGLRLIHVRAEPLVVALPENHALAAHQLIPLSALAEETFVMFPRAAAPDAFDTIAACCTQAGFTFDIGYEAPNDVSLLGVVSCGLAVALVPAPTANLSLPGVVYRPVAEGWAVTTMSLAFRDPLVSPAARHVLSVAGAL